MKWYVFALVAAAPAFAQSSIQRYEYDPSGNRTVGPSTTRSDGERAERTRSINGGAVAIEKVEERIVRSSDNERVVERILRRYNPEGQPAATQRVLIEETQLPGGRSSIRTSVYRSDLNGASQLIERSTEQIARSGDSTTREKVVERPSVAGSLAPAERSTTVEHKTGGSASASTVVLRLDANGRFVEAVRETSERQTAGGRSTESAARYEPDATGSMRLIEATERTSVKRADGSEAATVDVYAPSTPGLANENTRPRIKERQIIERRPVQGGTLETLSISRPGLSDPDRLGPPRLVSETVCTGKCN